MSRHGTDNYMESFRSEKGGNEGGLVRQMTFSKNKSSS